MIFLSSLSKSDILANSEFSMEKQRELVKSKTPIKVLSLDGRYVVYDGNGRFKAISQVFGDQPELLIEVEWVKTASEKVYDHLKQIRKLRGLRGI